MTDITIKDIKAALSKPAGPSSDFDLNKKVELPEGRKLRAASVLMLLADGVAGLDVILTKRSSQLKHHPGQIAFPGGKQDEGDADAWDCALREAEEEIGAARGRIEYLGELPDHETVTSFTVAPQVGYLTRAQAFESDDGEVAEVFRVPLAHFLEPANFRVEGRMWQGAVRYYYTVPYGPYYIWGATARILRGFAARFEP